MSKELFKDLRRNEKVLRKTCPKTHDIFLGRKYHVPAYRQADYVDHYRLSWFELDLLMQFASRFWRSSDEVLRCSVTNTIAALHYKRPVLWLEQELGEKLLATDVLEGLTTADIKWRWPAFKIMVPKGLIHVVRPSGIRYVCNFNVCQIEGVPDWYKLHEKQFGKQITPDELDVPLGDPRGLHCPLDIAQEIDKLIADMEGQNVHRLRKVALAYKENGICISASLDESETGAVGQQTLYGITKPWGSVDVSAFQAITGDLKTPFKEDALDKGLLHRLQHLVINTMLLLSAFPLEYEVNEHVLRKAKSKHHIAELLAAKFVGQVIKRPVRHKVEAPQGVVQGGYHLPGHWVKGHWRRQPFGPKGAERKLIWIMPYKTYDTPPTGSQEAA